MVPAGSSVMLEPIYRCTQLSRDCILCTHSQIFKITIYMCKFAYLILFSARVILFSARETAKKTYKYPYHGNTFSARHFIRTTKVRTDKVRRINNSQTWKRSLTQWGKFGYIVVFPTTWKRLYYSVEFKCDDSPRPKYATLHRPYPIVKNPL